MFIDIYHLFPRPSTESASGSWSEGNLFWLTYWRLTPVDLHLFRSFAGHPAPSDRDV